MDTSRNNVPSILAALRNPSRSRRKSANPCRMACETLEGRQLLTGGAPVDGAIAIPGTAEPVQIHTMMAQTAVTSLDAVDHITCGNDVVASDVRILPAISGPTSTIPLAASSALVTTTPGGIGQAIPFGIGADSVALDGPVQVASRGDFLATRGGVAMDADPVSVAVNSDLIAVNRLMMAPSDSGQDDGELGKAIRKLDADQTAINAKSEVTPEMIEAVEADRKAIDEARTTLADPVALAALQVSSEALQIAEVPKDELLATWQADQAAVYRSEGVSQQLIDQWNADQAKVKAASHATTEDLQLLAGDRAAIQAIQDTAIQNFRGASASDAISPGDVSTDVTVTTLAADVPLMAQSSVADPGNSDPSAPPTTLMADDGLIATTTIDPSDVKVALNGKPTGASIKFKGEGLKIKQIKGAIGKGRLGRAARMRFLHSGPRGGVRMS